MHNAHALFATWLYRYSLQYIKYIAAWGKAIDCAACLVLSFWMRIQLYILSETVPCMYTCMYWTSVSSAFRMLSNNTCVLQYSHSYSSIKIISYISYYFCKCLNLIQVGIHHDYNFIHVTCQVSCVKSYIRAATMHTPKLQ